MCITHPNQTRGSIRELFVSFVYKKIISDFWTPALRSTALNSRFPVLILSVAQIQAYNTRRNTHHKRQYASGESERVSLKLTLSYSANVHFT